MDDVFNILEACKYLHCCESTLRKLIKQNKIPSYRIANRIFLKKTLLDQWIENQCKDNCENKEVKLIVIE